MNSKHWNKTARLSSNKGSNVVQAQKEIDSSSKSTLINQPLTKSFRRFFGHFSGLLTTIFRGILARLYPESGQVRPPYPYQIWSPLTVVRWLKEQLVKSHLHKIASGH